MKRKQDWNVGDFFSIPLSSGDHGLGQILAYEGSALGAVVCVIFGERYAGHIREPVGGDISVIYTTNHHLNSSRWKIVGTSVPVVNVEDKLSADRGRGFVGVEVYGADVVEDFLNAFFGNLPWDTYFRSDFFDDMLLASDKKPIDLIYRS